MEDLSFDRYEVQPELSAAEMADLNSTDRTHGKMGHLCSSLCGAAMLRVAAKRERKAVKR